MKKLLFLCCVLFTVTAACSAAPAANNLVGAWTGVILGPGNHLVIRIGGDQRLYTATTDSIDQHLIGLPTGVTMDAAGNVTIVVKEPNPLTFTGKLDGTTIKGTWAEDTHSGDMTLTRSDDLSNLPATTPVPHLAGVWEGVRTGIAFHYVFHISGSGTSYRATADSPDQNVMGLSSGVKIDSMNNVFLSIGFPHPFYFTGIIINDTMVGTWSQSGAIGEIVFNRQTH
jgi:hypothetical protein